jgi:predicted RNA-binding Zn ribbon-like protein
VEFGSYLDTTVALAVDVVNALTPGACQGRPKRRPDGEELRSLVLSLFSDRPNRARIWESADDAELVALRDAAAELREVFEVLDRGETDAAAERLNALMRSHDARPELSRHDDQPLHLHFHESAASPTSGVVAGAATGLAMVLASTEGGRLGICRADSCDRVFVDTSRNASRRYCSTACQNRAKAAAFRARRAAGR